LINEREHKGKQTISNSGCDQATKEIILTTIFLPSFVMTDIVSEKKKRENW